MARRRRGTGDKLPPFVPLLKGMLTSDAWRHLSGPAVKVWCELNGRYHGSNNGELSLSLLEAARLLGLSKTTAKRAFEELEAMGFIKLRRKGTKLGRQASEWSVTHQRMGTHAPTNEWRSWRPDKARQRMKLSPSKKQRWVPLGHSEASDGNSGGTHQREAEPMSAGSVPVGGQSAQS